MPLIAFSSNIPVFHDDQRGTAGICAAALINALYLPDRKRAEWSWSSWRRMYEALEVHGSGPGALHSVRFEGTSVERPY